MIVLDPASPHSSQCVNLFPSYSLLPGPKMMSLVGERRQMSEHKMMIPSNSLVRRLKKTLLL